MSQLLRHPGSVRRVLCFGVSSSMAALSSSQLLLLIWRPWVALYDRARSAVCCAAIRAAHESPCAVFDRTLNESAVSALQSAHALLCESCGLRAMQCACRSFAYVVSLLASTLLLGLGGISKDLSWFTPGQVYLIHGWLLVGLHLLQHGRAQGNTRDHLEAGACE